MDENKIRQMMQEEIRKSNSSGRFGIQSIPHHTHNGVDSLPVYSPTYSFVGFVPYDTTDSSLGFFIPKGWSVANDSTGNYQIFHNLGTQLYSFVADTTQGTGDKVSCVVSPFNDQVEINWYKTSDGSAVDVSFNFILTQINNRNVSKQTYSAQNKS